MALGVTVRSGSKADLAAVRVVTAAACEAPAVAAFLAARFGPDALGRWCADADCLLVADVSGQTVGYLAWRQDETVGVVGPHAVLPAYRGLGVGRALLVALVARLRGEGLRLLEGTAPASSRASCRLYEGQGFRAVGRAGGRDTWVQYEKRLVRR